MAVAQGRVKVAGSFLKTLKFESGELKDSICRATGF